MKYLLPTVDNNAVAFSEHFPSEITDSCLQMLEHTDEFRDSYRRIISLQAWRVRFFEVAYPSSVHSLFLEAQNDALLSLVLAHTAMWRPALQSLRSCVESVLNTCYYVDHPVEFQLWEQGQHTVGFSELIKYFSLHPKNVRMKKLPNVLQHLRSEYGDLSRAVHASAKGFHMTKAGVIALTNSNEIDYSQWISRHSKSLLWLNLLLVILYSTFLEGSENRDLRKSISLVIPESYHEAIYSELNVRLFPLQ